MTHLSLIGIIAILSGISGKNLTKKIVVPISDPYARLAFPMVVAGLFVTRFCKPRQIRKEATVVIDVCTKLGLDDHHQLGLRSEDCGLRE